MALKNFGDTFPSYPATQTDLPMARRIKRRFFEGPLVDEVMLADHAREILKEYSNMPLTRNELIQLLRRTSADIAARTFYESLLVSEHGEFIQKLDRYASDRVEHRADIRIVILPGMFYREHPEMGGDGSQIRETASLFGFDVEVINTESTGSVSRNSSIIAERLEDDTHDNIWLFAISKGSSDLRHYLQNYRLNNKIRGCVNISGIPAGVPYIDYRLSNTMKKLFIRLLCSMFKVDYLALDELRAKHEYWKNDLWPENLETIHLQPIPHSAHIHGALRKKYHLTMKDGPNDGFIPLTDVLDWPGSIYPLWGCDHFLRTGRVSECLYQLFNYIAEQSNNKRKIQ